MIQYKHKHIISKRGSGIFDTIKPIIDIVDDNKELIKDVAQIAQVGKNTKKIVDAIKSSGNSGLTTNERLALEKSDLKHIIDRIKNIKTGSGFAVI